MKEIMTKGALIIIMLIILVGCSGGGINELDSSQDDTKSLIMSLGSEPEEGFDPCIGWGRYGSPLFQSTLIETDHNMDIIYDMAREYTISEDGLVWTFILREDAFFTDGERVGADDVVFTFNTAKSSGSIVDLTNIKSVSILDDFKVQFKLNKADSSFIYTIAATGIVPKHLYGPGYGDNPIGSGPYMLEQWDKGQQIIMTANENYYGKIPEIKKVTIMFLEEDGAFAAAKAGNLDVAVTSANLAGRKLTGMNLTSIKSIDNRGLTLPYVKDEGKQDVNGNKIGNNITSDIAIRRALSYGIDRNSLVEQVINGYGRSAYTECDGMPWANDGALVEYDIEKANSILEDSGWIYNNDGIRQKNGIIAQFNLLYDASDSTRQALATAVALQAKKIGINISVEGTSWDVISKRMFSESVLMGWGAQSPIETYLLYHSENMGKDYYNPGYFSNDIVDSYIDKAMSSLDKEESFKYWKKAQWDGETGLSTDGESPWVWLLNVDHLYYIKEGLDIGTQKIHPHGHAWPLVANLKDWKWNKN